MNFNFLFKSINISGQTYMSYVFLNVPSIGAYWFILMIMKYFHIQKLLTF